MIPAKRLLGEIAASLREVIAPAVSAPYPKSQAYMAAVILDFVARQIEERPDTAAGKRTAIDGAFDELGQMPQLADLVSRCAPTEEGMSHLIELLYSERERLGEETFALANRTIRAALRHLLDEDLKVAGKGE